VLYDQILPYHLLKFCLEAYRKDYNNEEDPFLSPLIMDKRVMSQLPPVRIIAGSSDPLRDDSLLFLKKLV
jgi:hormone-sensitive lipase